MIEMSVSKMTLEIVPADITELDTVAALFDQYRVFYGYLSNLPEVRDFLFDRMSRQEALIFIAREAFEEGDAKPVGFMLLYPSFSSLALGPILYLNDLFVVPTERRKGIAQEMVAHAKALAREFGYSKIQLETATTNDPAKSLYESLGYVKEEQFDRYYLTV